MIYKLRFILFLLLILSGLAGCANQGSTTHNQAATTTRSVSSNPALAQEQTATMYYQTIQAQNYPLAYLYLDSNATDRDGQKITLNSFEQAARDIDTQEGPVTSFSVVAYPPTVIMTITRSLQGAYHAHLQMKQEGQVWKIIAMDRI